MGAVGSFNCADVCRPTETDVVTDAHSPRTKLSVVSKQDAEGLPTLLPGRKKGDSVSAKVNFSNNDAVFELPHDGRVKERKGTGYVTKEELLSIARRQMEEDTDSDYDSNSSRDQKVTFKEEAFDMPHDGRVKARKGTGYVTKLDLANLVDTESNDDGPKVRFGTDEVGSDLAQDGRIKARKQTGYVTKAELAKVVDASRPKVSIDAPDESPRGGRVKARKGTGYVRKQDLKNLVDTEETQHVNFQSADEIFESPRDGRVKARKGTGFVTAKQIAEAVEKEAVEGNYPSNEEYHRMRTSMLFCDDIELPDDDNTGESNQQSQRVKASRVGKI